MNRKIVLTAALIGSSILLPTFFVNTAHAQKADKAKGREAYRKGFKQYNLGRWKAAIALFEQAYSLDPDAAYLYNIAQSYRFADDCKQAAFFYKRYLSINSEAPNRTEVEGYIRDLDNTCRDRGQNSLRPPDNEKDPIVKDPKDGNLGVTKIDPNKPNKTAIKSDPAKTQVAASTDPKVGDISTTRDPAESANDGPSLLVAYAYAGPALQTLPFDDMGRGTISDWRANITVGAGYPLKLGPVHVDAGPLISLSSLAWVTGDAPNEARGTLGFAAVLANFGARYEIIDKLMLRGEFGLGALYITGLDVDRNPFINREPGGKVSSLFARFAVRVAFGAEYALTDNLALSVEPVVLRIAPSSGEEFAVKSFNSIQSLFGLRYSI